jgi:hypothetical protein
MSEEIRRWSREWREAWESIEYEVHPRRKSGPGRAVPFPRGGPRARPG